MANTIQYSDIMRAINQKGWRLIAHYLPTDHPRNKVQLFLVADENHPSTINKWAAQYTPFAFSEEISILVPHWFKKELDK